MYNIIVALYRVPEEDFNYFLEVYDDLLGRIAPTNKTIVINGHFNITFNTGESKF